MTRTASRRNRNQQCQQLEEEEEEEEEGRAGMHQASKTIAEERERKGGRW